MQKFVVIRKKEQSPVDCRHNNLQQDIILPAQVEMSGYLKKKRNKVGGWKKLWFVLQNQLLLSYTSKEDYEKKLAPFKDVLNLVPGTIVRPAAGPRFTIETTSNNIYTFRCEDNKTCSEWITALVESLSLGAQILPDCDMSSQNQFHYTYDNMIYQKKMIKKINLNEQSRSWESLSQQAKLNAGGGGRVVPARLPIAETTARILQRGGLATNGVVRYEDNNNTFSTITPSSSVTAIPVLTSPSVTNQIQNFRLHQDAFNARVNQSIDVCRINSMFRRHDEKQILLNNNNNNNSNSNRNSANNKVDNNNKNIFIKCKNIDCNQNKMEIIDEVGSLMEHMKSISLDNGLILCNSDDDEDDPSHYVYPKNIENINICDKINKMNNTNVNGNISVNYIDVNNDVKHQLEHQQQHDNYIRGMESSTSISNANIGEKSGEPIYAVVNLKDKYERRRAKLKEIEEQYERERPKSTPIAAGDYEEVNNFRRQLYNDNDDDEDEGNIYEPVNIPEQKREVLWRYFPKINIDALMEMTRRRRDHHKNKHEHELEKLNKETTSDIQEFSTFSNMRKKFGNHRKSIKNKMRKFYSRDNRPTTGIITTTKLSSLESSADEKMTTSSTDSKSSYQSESSTHSTDEYSLTSESIIGNLPKNSYILGGDVIKYRRERNLFGSLSRLRKSRTSACLDDVILPKKKILLHSDDSSNDFQKELKREVNRRVGQKVSKYS